MRNSSLTVRRHRRWRVLLCAAVLAGGGTYALHRWVVRVPAERPWESTGFYATIYINGLVGLPVRYQDLEPQPYHLENAEIAAFCQRVVERAKPLVPSSPTYTDVWIDVFNDWTVRGWPFVSRERSAIVVVDGFQFDNVYETFTAGPDGEPPIRYGGLIGNWAFCFPIACLLCYVLERGVTSMIDRRRRRRLGFPVITDDS